MFTIEVEKIKKDDKNFWTLFQKIKATCDCQEQKAWARIVRGNYYHNVLRIDCNKCGKTIQIIFVSIKADIIKTAVGGKERNLADNVRVIRKS